MTVQANITNDHEWYVSEDKAITITVYQADGVTLQNLTGYTLQWTLRTSRYTIGAAIITKSGGAISVATPANGQAVIDIDSADTSSLKAGTYYHALWRMNAGSKDLLAEGYAILRKASAS